MTLSISLSGATIDHDQHLQQIIQAKPHIKKLYLSGLTELSDEACITIGKVYPQLTELALGVTKITLIGLLNLAINCPNLIYLSIDEDTSTRSPLQATQLKPVLSKMKNLRVFHLSTTEGQITNLQEAVSIAGQRTFCIRCYRELFAPNRETSMKRVFELEELVDKKYQEHRLEKENVLQPVSRPAEPLKLLFEQNSESQPRRIHSFITNRFTY